MFPCTFFIDSYVVPGMVGWRGRGARSASVLDARRRVYARQTDRLCSLAGRLEMVCTRADNGAWCGVLMREVKGENVSKPRPNVFSA